MGFNDSDRAPPGMTNWEWDNYNQSVREDVARRRADRDASSNAWSSPQSSISAQSSDNLQSWLDDHAHLNWYRRVPLVMSDRFCYAVWVIFVLLAPALLAMETQWPVHSETYSLLSIVANWFIWLVPCAVFSKFAIATALRNLLRSAYRTLPAIFWFKAVVFSIFCIFVVLAIIKSD